MECNHVLEFATELDVNNIPFRVVPLRLWVVVWVGRVECRLCMIRQIIRSASYQAQRHDSGRRRTIWCVLLDDLHHAYDPRYFAIGVVEKGVIALLHRPNVVPCYRSVSLLFCDGHSFIHPYRRGCGRLRKSKSIPIHHFIILKRSETQRLTIPRLWLLSRLQIVNGELHVHSFFYARFRLCLHQPV